MKKLVFLLLLIASCTPPKPAPVIPQDTDQCVPACEYMRNMRESADTDHVGCWIAEDLEDGTPCEIFCVEFQTQGIPLMPSCILEQTYCDEIEPNCFHH